MKVLFTLTRAFNPNAAGVQRTTYKLGRYFTEHGLTVAYWSTHVDGHTDVDYGTLFSAQEPGGMNSKTNCKALIDLLHSWQPDVVINQMPYEDGLREILSNEKESVGYTLAGCLRNSLFNFISNVRHKTRQTLPNWAFRLVDNSLGLSLIKQFHKWKHSRDLRKILDDHDYYVLLTPPNKEELQFFVGNYQESKWLVVPNSIPAVFPDSLHKKENIILYVGSLNIEQKRADLLLPFWKEVAPLLPDWQFLIVGHGNYAESLARDIDQLQLERVSLEGFQKPESYYKRASLFVMPSAYEGFPNTILEAHSYGCPVLAFDSYAALRWIVHDKVDAHVAPPFDVKALADNAVTVAENKEVRESMQVAALANAQRFTIDTVGPQWIKLFNTWRKA